MQKGGLGSVPISHPGNSPQPIDPKQPAESDCSEDAEENASGECGPAPGPRELRLAEIKAAIEAGEYDTDEKLEAALSRMFDQLGMDDE